MNSIITSIILFVAAIALGVMAFAAMAFVGLKQQEVTNEARYQCALSSKYEVVDGDATVTYPVSDLYQKCLQEKGIN